MAVCSILILHHEVVKASLHNGKVSDDHSWAEEMAGHESGKATVQTLSLASTADIHLCIFRKARFGNLRCWWSLVDIYHRLKLAQYQGQPSKWCYNNRASWGSACKELVLWLLICLVCVIVVVIFVV